MGLETSVAYISDLVAANPAEGDSRTEGDDHLRNIKTALAGSFPNFAGAAATPTEVELNAAAGVTLGTVIASKNLTADSSGVTKDADFTAPTIRSYILDTNGVANLEFKKTASAENWLKVTNQISGQNPKLIADGNDTDSDVGVDILSKGNGNVKLLPQGTGKINLSTGTAIDGVLNESDMATNSATQLATQQSIKAYIDNRHFVSSNTTYTGDDQTIANEAHGITLGTPQAVQVYGRCIAAGGSIGYAQNDVVNLTAASPDGTNDHGIMARIDATNVSAQVAQNGIEMVNKSDGNVQSMVTSEWEIFFIVTFYG